MSFSTIRDQSIALRFLRNALRLRRVPNGLLFWGPGGVGKMLTAQAMAMAVNCREVEGDACGTCLSCRKTAHGTHPDVAIIRPKGKTRIIKTEVIDTVAETSAYRPFEGGRRVFIFEDAERMNEAAQNHFLKTLEEPRSDTTFILVTEHPGRLLPTIRSRCQQVLFGSLRPDTVKDLLLQTFALPEEVAEALGAVSQGRMDRARDLVESDKREIVLSVTQRLAEGEDAMVVGEEFSAHLTARNESLRASVKEGAKEEAQDMDFGKDERDDMKAAVEAAAEAAIRREMLEYMYLFQTWYRDALVYGATHDGARVLNRDQLGRLKAEHTRMRPEKLTAIGTAWTYIERNLNRDRVFRDLFMTLAG